MLERPDSRELLVDPVGGAIQEYVEDSEVFKGCVEAPLPRYACSAAQRSNWRKVLAT